MSSDGVGGLEEGGRTEEGAGQIGPNTSEYLIRHPNYIFGILSKRGPNHVLNTFRIAICLLKPRRPNTRPSHGKRTVPNQLAGHPF